MGRRDQVCKVCSAPAEVRSVIDQELLRDKSTRKSLDEISALSGYTFSRSGLSRHTHRCLNRRLLESYRRRAPGARKGGGSWDGLRRVLLEIRDETKNPPTRQFTLYHRESGGGTWSTVDVESPEMLKRISADPAVHQEAWVLQFENHKRRPNPYDLA